MLQKSLSKSLTLYVPENLDIDELVKKNSPNFKYHKDCFIYLIHLLTDIPSRNKDEEMYYVPLYSILLQRKVRDYRKYLDYLVDNGVFYENRQYLKGEKSRSFRFTEKYQTLVKPVIITKQTLIKSIIKYINVETSYNDNNNCFIEDSSNLDYLHYWFSTGKLTVDFKNAEKYLWNLLEEDKKNEFNIFSSEGKKIDPMMRLNLRRLPLLKLHRKQFLNTVDTTAGRLHTVLTQLKGDLRQFITYDNLPLVAIDIVNSQPYLASVLLNTDKFKENNILNLIQLYNPNYTKSQINLDILLKMISDTENKPDTINYIHAVKKGQFYEEFGKLLNIEQFDRKQVKEATFCSIFSPNQLAPHLKEIGLFNKAFPNVFKVFKKIKQGKGTHRTLACMLQNLEANLVLHKACKIISEERPEIPLFTLHDAIITTEGNEEYVKDVLYNVLLNAIGIPPTLKFEKWEQTA